MICLLCILISAPSNSRSTPSRASFGSSLDPPHFSRHHEHCCRPPDRRCGLGHCESAIASRCPQAPVQLGDAPRIVEWRGSSVQAAQALRSSAMVHPLLHPHPLPLQRRVTSMRRTVKVCGAASIGIACRAPHCKREPARCSWFADPGSRPPQRGLSFHRAQQPPSGPLRGAMGSCAACTARLTRSPSSPLLALQAKPVKSSDSVWYGEFRATMSQPEQLASRRPQDSPAYLFRRRR